MPRPPYSVSSCSAPPTFTKTQESHWQATRKHSLSSSSIFSLKPTTMEKPATGISHPPSGTPVVESEYCPQAVADWYTLGGEDEDYKSSFKKKGAKEKPRKHLAAVGREFSYAQKGVKRGLRDTSPSGNCFPSLRTASEGCIDEGGVSPSVGSNPVHRLSKTAENDVASGSVCGRIARYRKPIKCTDLGFNVKGELAGHPKRRRGKVLSEMKKIREQSSGTQPNGSGKSAISSTSNKKARSILSLLIDKNVLLPRTRVHYRGRTGCAPSKKGHITRDGIVCNCCCELFSLTAFEAHAGSSNHRPAANILLEDGRSLQDCRRQVIDNNDQNNNFIAKLKENDEICSVCHYVGELVLCGHCPSSFHKSCIGLQDVPDGDWSCPSCACGVCGHGKFEEDNGHFMGNDFVTCKQCEHKFHIGCLKSKETVNKDHWFCGRKCERIFLGLGKLLGKPIPVGVDNLTWTLLKSADSESCNLDTPDIDSRLKAAISVMHEIFEPVIQPLTNRDLVEDVIFSSGSELKESNFRGFYTVLLERNDEVICVATVRIYGEKLAEIPLVGTSFQHRRCGMCRILMDELEKQLMALGVERLILHAAPTVLKTWTTSFGFSKMTDFEKVQFLDYTFLEFQDTIMCQKLLMKKPAAEIVDQGLVDSAVKHGKLIFQEAIRGSNSDYSKRRKKISACESRHSIQDTSGRHLMPAF
jgi:N-acetylglutamate synthase-like GNAT family acetyltransferase